MLTLKSKKIRTEVQFVKFVGPALVLYSIFFVLPLVGAFIYSFTDWNGLKDGINFTGLANYVNLLTNDHKFLTSLITTSKLAVMFVIAVNVLGLALAILLDSVIIKNATRKNIYRSLIFIPNSISLIIVAFIWQFMFTKVFSQIVNLVGLDFLDISWFGNGTSALLAVLVAMVWQCVGYYMVVYIAGLQTIDMALIESASIDGATGWSMFKNITLPLIIPSITVNLFLSLAQGFKAFEVIFQMTSGGPGRTTSVLALDIYQEAFSRGRIGYASAKGIVFAILILLFTYIQIKYLKSREVRM